MNYLRNRYIAFCTVLLFVVFSGGLVAQQMGKVQFRAGGNTVTVQSGGYITVASGGTLTLQSGAAFLTNGATIDSVTAKRFFPNYTGGIATPSIALSTDKNTGIYWLTATGNRLGITAKGANVAIFDSAGAIIVGTVSTTTVNATSLNLSGVPVTTSNLWTGTENVVALLADSTLMAYTSGTTYIARPIAAKATATLCAEAGGVNFTFFAADADSFRITAVGTDSLITSTGAACKTAATVAGTVKVKGLAATGKWFMMQTVGTWAVY